MKIRWKNYRAFEDTGWIEIPALTVLIGPNGSGKSSLMQPLLLLRQTFQCTKLDTPLLTAGELINVGTFDDIIFNHRNKSKIEFSINFDFGSNKQTDLYDMPPMAVHLSFLMGKEKLPALHSYIVTDALDREMLKRTLKSDGFYSLESKIKFPRKSKNDKIIYGEILKQKPELFLFNEMDIIRKRFRYEKNAPVKKSNQLGFSKEISLYLSILAFVRGAINGLLSAQKYVGPMRNYPKRLYEYSGERHADVGQRGEHMFTLLHQIYKDENKKHELNKWLKILSLANGISYKRVPRKSHLYEIELKSYKSGLSINYADSSFGVSQILPLLVQAISSSRRDTIIVEQPEVHMNPKLGSLLAEFIVNLTTKNNIHFIVETHSEHFLMRLRTMIRKGLIPPKDVALYYTNNDRGKCKLRRIEIDKDGNFPNNDWPKDFFHDALIESLRFASTAKNTK
jgi:predicted ATPase